MIAAEILVSLVKAPGNRKAGDNSAEEVFGFVNAQDGSAGAIEIFLAGLGVQVLEGALPLLPLRHVVIAGGVVGREEGRDGLLACFCPDTAEAEGENKFTVAGGEIDFSGECDISIFGAVVLGSHLKIAR